VCGGGYNRRKSDAKFRLLRCGTMKSHWRRKSAREFAALRNGR